MNKLSDRLNRLSYSQTFVMSNKAREMKAAGIDVISLTLGEPDFDVLRISNKLLLMPLIKIFSLFACSRILELRQTIAKSWKEIIIWIINRLNMCFQNGAKQSILNVLAAVVNDGDEGDFTSSLLGFLRRNGENDGRNFCFYRNEYWHRV